MTNKPVITLTRDGDKLIVCVLDCTSFPKDVKVSFNPPFTVTLTFYENGCITIGIPAGSTSVLAHDATLECEDAPLIF